MLAIRFQRRGRKNDPSFRIIVSEKARTPKAGNPLEVLGSYDPITKDTAINAERVKHWISKGAELSGTVNNLLISKGVIEGKKVNVLSKKKPIVKEEEPKKEEAAAAPKAETAAAPQAEEAPAEVAQPEGAPKAEESQPEAQAEGEKKE